MSDEPRGEMRLILAKLIALENRLRMLESLTDGASDVSEMGPGPGPQVISDVIDHPFKVTFDGSNYDVAAGRCVWWDATSGAEQYRLDIVSSSDTFALPAATMFKAIYIKASITSESNWAFDLYATADVADAATAYTTALAVANGELATRIWVVAIVNAAGVVDQRLHSDLIVGRES